MKSKFSTLMQSENSFKQLKGQCIPLTTSTGIIPILRIYTINSNNSLLPYVAFETKSIWYFGCLLARHSSDLLVYIARSVWKTQEISSLTKGFQIIQYQFPREEYSTKLIILTPFEEPDPNRIEQLKSWCLSFQQQFIHRLMQISQIGSS